MIPNDPSELVKQFSLMVDSKISAAQVAAGESFAGFNDQIEALKKGKSIEDGTYIPEANSAGTSATQDQFFGMQPNSFPGQTPLPSTVHAPPVPPVISSTGQTGPIGQYPTPSAPHTSDPNSAAPSQTNEIVMHTGPHATSQQVSGPHRGPIPNTNMAYTGPTTRVSKTGATVQNQNSSTKK